MDKTKLQFVLYFSKQQFESQECVKMVPDKTRIHIQDVSTLPTDRIPNWLNGTPLLLHIPTNQIYRGSQAKLELEKYIQFLDKHFVLDFRGNPMMPSAQALDLLTFNNDDSNYPNHQPPQQLNQYPQQQPQQPNQYPQQQPEQPLTPMMRKEQIQRANTVQQLPPKNIDDPDGFQLPPDPRDLAQQQVPQQVSQQPPQPQQVIPSQPIVNQQQVPVVHIPPPPPPPTNNMGS